MQLPTYGLFRLPGVIPMSLGLLLQEKIPDIKPYADRISRTSTDRTRTATRRSTGVDASGHGEDFSNRR